MKIYDTFLFFNELELLEIRLNTLNDCVDFFVLIESTKTFSGLDKELFYEKNKELFKDFHHKIIHLVVDSYPTSFEEAKSILNNPNTSDIDKEILTNTLTTDSVPYGEMHWFREFYQRESIKKALINLSDDDICFISDVDEIWNPSLSEQISKSIELNKNNIFRLRQTPYVYYLNNKSSEDWTGTIVTSYALVKNACLNHLRIKSKTECPIIENGGWHFTYQGGVDRVKKKIESYGHQEFNTSYIKDNIENKINNNQDFIGRGFEFCIDNTNLPKYVEENIEKFNNWIK